ncbi:hypothetical protein J6590_053014, partial [Homalodisca vitripennis]
YFDAVEFLVAVNVLFAGDLMDSYKCPFHPFRHPSRQDGLPPPLPVMATARHGTAEGRQCRNIWILMGSGDNIADTGCRARNLGEWCDAIRRSVTATLLAVT